MTQIWVNEEAKDNVKAMKKLYFKDRSTAISCNYVNQPYAGELPDLQLKHFFSMEGYQLMRAKVQRNWNNSLGFFRLRRADGALNLLQRKQELITLYEQINAYMAQDNELELMKRLTPNMFETVRYDLLRRRGLGWHRVKWELADPIDFQNFEFLHVRLAAAPHLSASSVDAAQDDDLYVQMTAQINSWQRFAAYNSRGKVVEGEEDVVKHVQEIWIFERILKAPVIGEARWRLAGRLYVPGVKKEIIRAG